MRKIYTSIILLFLFLLEMRLHVSYLLNCLKSNIILITDYNYEFESAVPTLWYCISLDEIGRYCVYFNFNCINTNIQFVLYYIVWSPIWWCWGGELYTSINNCVDRRHLYIMVSMSVVLFGSPKCTNQTWL